MSDEEGRNIVENTYTDPITGKFTPGNPGKPKGAVSFMTKWERVIEKIAKQNNITVDDVDEQLVLVAYRKAKEGDYSFYKDTMDRIHGKPLQPTDLTTGGKELPTPLIQINALRPDNSDKQDIETEQED